MAIPFIPEIKILGRLSRGGYYPTLTQDQFLRNALAEEFREIVRKKLPDLKFSFTILSSSCEYFQKGGFGVRDKYEPRYNNSYRWHIDASTNRFSAVVICNVSDAPGGVSNTQMITNRLTIECPEKTFGATDEIYDLIYKQARRNKAKRIMDTEDGVIYMMNELTLHRTQAAKAAGNRMFLRDYLLEKTPEEIESEKALLRGDHMKNAQYASSARFTLHRPEFLRHNKLKAGLLPPPIIDILRS